MPSIVWWGKLLLFLAGLSAVIDVLDPAKLRACGVGMRKRAARASRHRRRLMQIRRLLILCWKVFQTLIDLHLPAYKGAPSYYILAPEPPDTSPVEQVDVAAFTRFWHQVTNEVRNRFSLPVDMDSAEGKELQWLVEERIGDLLRTTVTGARTWPVDEAAAAERRSRRRMPRWGFSVVVIVALMFGLLKMEYMLGWGSLEGATLFGVSFAIFLVTIGLTVTPGTVGAIGWSAIAFPLMWSGRVLNRSHPLHPFRKVALLFFVVGSLIDLIT